MVTSKRDKALLRRLRELVNFETASFGSSNDAVMVREVGRTPHEQHPTDYIKERTRPYRDSWINPILDELEGKARYMSAGDLPLRCTKEGPR